MTRPDRPSRTVLPWLAASALLGVGCGRSCGSDEAAGEGAQGAFVRCMDVDEPAARSGRASGVQFALTSRVLRVTPDGPLDLVALRGAGLDAPGLAQAIAGIAEHRPDLVFVLGGLGATAASAARHLDALAALDVPVVVVPGGDDLSEALDAGFATPRGGALFDGRALRRVDVPSAHFLLLSGAPDGRYAASNAHCGHTVGDRRSLEAGEGRTFVVSWAAPTGPGASAVARGYGGTEAGDPTIGAWLDDLGEPGGIFAVPGTRPLSPAPPDGARILPAGEPHPALRVVVPRVAGPTDERDDLSLAPTGAAVLRLEAEGLVYVGAMVGGAP